MNITTLACPRCGAAGLKRGPDGGAYCEYCGSSFLLDEIEAPKNVLKTVEVPLAVTRTVPREGAYPRDFIRKAWQEVESFSPPMDVYERDFQPVKVCEFLIATDSREYDIDYTANVEYVREVPYVDRVYKNLKAGEGYIDGGVVKTAASDGYYYVDVNKTKRVREPRLVSGTRGGVTSTAFACVSDGVSDGVPGENAASREEVSATLPDFENCLKTGDFSTLKMTRASRGKDFVPFYDRSFDETVEDFRKGEETGVVMTVGEAERKYGCDVAEKLEKAHKENLEWALEGAGGPLSGMNVSDLSVTVRNFKKTADTSLFVAYRYETSLEYDGTVCRFLGYAADKLYLSSPDRAALYMLRKKGEKAAAATKPAPEPEKSGTEKFLEFLKNNFLLILSGALLLSGLIFMSNIRPLFIVFCLAGIGCSIAHIYRSAFIKNAKQNKKYAKERELKEARAKKVAEIIERKVADTHQ